MVSSNLAPLTIASSHRHMFRPTLQREVGSLWPAEPEAIDLRRQSNGCLSPELVGPRGRAWVGAAPAGVVGRLHSASDRPRPVPSIPLARPAPVAASAPEAYRRVALRALQATACMATLLPAAICAVAASVAAMGFFVAYDTATRPLGRVFQLAGVAMGLGVGGLGSAVALLFYAESQSMRRHTSPLCGGQTLSVRSDSTAMADAARWLEHRAFGNVSLVLLWSGVARPVGTRLLFDAAPPVGAVEGTCRNLLLGVYLGLLVAAALFNRGHRVGGTPATVR